MAGAGFAEVGKLVGRATLGQRARGVEVGDEHFLLGAEHFVGLAHEVYAAHHYHARVRLGRLTGQRQRVAYEIRYLLDLRTRIIMRHYKCLLLPAQFLDLVDYLLPCDFFHYLFKKIKI